MLLLSCVLNMEVIQNYARQINQSINRKNITPQYLRKVCFAYAKMLFQKILTIDKFCNLRLN